MEGDKEVLKNPIREEPKKGPPLTRDFSRQERPNDLGSVTTAIVGLIYRFARIGINQPKEAVEEGENEKDKDETKEQEDTGDHDKNKEEEAEHQERARAPSELSPTPTGAARAVERRSWTEHKGEQERERAKKLGNMTKVQQQQEKGKKVLEPLEGIEDSTMLKGVMLNKNVTHSERQKRIIQPTQVTPMLPCCEEGDRRKILKQELAEHRMQTEKMEDKMQQNEDQKRRMEVNMQARKTQLVPVLRARDQARDLQGSEDEANMEGAKVQDNPIGEDPKEGPPSTGTSHNKNDPTRPRKDLL